MIKKKKIIRVKWNNLFAVENVEYTHTTSDNNDGYDEILLYLVFKESFISQRWN